MLLLVVAPSPESIDMEEAPTWEYAKLATFGDVIDELAADGRSEAQMPVAMMFHWAWARVTGTSEYALRLLNLVWAWAALLALIPVARRLAMPWLPLFFAIQPFVWYAMDDAKPWMMQMAGGALLVAGTASAVKRSRFTFPNLAALCAGSLLLAGGSMLGLIPTASVLTGLIVQGIWRHLPGSWPGKLLLAVTAVILGTLSFYYFMTVLRGTGASRIWSVTPLNVLFVTYEFLGLQGLGPARQTLRAIFKGLESPAPIFYALPGILLLLACHAGVMIAAFKSWLTRECTTPRPSAERLRVWAMCVGVCVQSAILIYLIGTLISLPFWGRHLVGAFPFFVTGLALVVQFAHQGLWRRFGRAASVLLCMLLFTGSLLIRFSPVHAKDDYRSAAAMALRLATESKTVLWCADHSAANYYGIAFSPTPSPGQISPATNLESPPANLPDIIVLSKPDTFDPNRVLRQSIERAHFREIATFQAFRILAKKPDRANSP
ncbi:MAG: hypothetical protein SFU53_01405 [Terrimicrobiaceae bacterium]|nr:hypothetical protein [Terrimicrobiaceae bacterium]